MSELSDNIHRLRLSGLSYRQIQKELGCSKSSISYHLGVGQKVKNLQRTRDRRSLIKSTLDELKHNKTCVDCGENYPYWMMDFDHLGEVPKLFTIGEYRKVGVSLEKVLEEVDKCEIVCANCHRNRTHFRASTTISDELENLYREIE